MRDQFFVEIRGLFGPHPLVVEGSAVFDKDDMGYETPQNVRIKSVKPGYLTEGKGVEYVKDYDDRPTDELLEIAKKMLPLVNVWDGYEFFVGKIQFPIY